jgi:hypothetical protein
MVAVVRAKVEVATGVAEVVVEVVAAVGAVAALIDRAGTGVLVSVTVGGAGTTAGTASTTGARTADFSCCTSSSGNYKKL